MREDIRNHSDLSSFAALASPVGCRTAGQEFTPPVLKTAALHGVAGTFTKIIEPESEADSTAILVQFLVAMGAYLGRDAGHYQVEATTHYPNLFAVLVGTSSKGRKGTAREGLIWCVHDEIRETRQLKKKGRVSGTEQVVVEQNVEDKRLLVVEPEFARALQVAQREGSILSAVIRESWDSGNLGIMTRTKRVRVTGAHVSILGHITREELARSLSTTEVCNGYANRFLWVHTRRSKKLPFGGNLREDALDPVKEKILGITRAQTASLRRSILSNGRMRFGQEAAELWKAVYNDLSGEKTGLFGAVTGRAEAQTIRLALLYALLDGATEIALPHLNAALAIWDYCEASARCIFGQKLGDETADVIQSYLRTAGQGGATRTEITNIFQRNKSSAEIERALGVLVRSSLARCEKEEKESGRNIERWWAIEFEH